MQPASVKRHNALTSASTRSRVLPLGALGVGVVVGIVIFGTVVGSIVGAPAGLAVTGVAPTPPLTTRVPALVSAVCTSARRSSPLRVVCPPLVPVSRYVKIDGLYGAFVGSQGRPRVTGAKRLLYLVGFNAGDNGPGFVHWVAGMGSSEAIRYWVLSDARNVVRGRPKLVRTLLRDGRQVDVWRFPAYPAGGQFGGHMVALAHTRSRLALASIHGYESAEACIRMAIALARKAEATP